MILNAFKVIIGTLVDGLLADDASGMVLTGCFFGGNTLTVTFLWFLAVEHLEMLPLCFGSQTGWKFCLPLGLQLLCHILSSSKSTMNLEMGKDTEHLAAHTLAFTVRGLHHALESSDPL